MAEATDPVPSDGLRLLIVRAAEKGRDVEREVREFAAVARQAALEFAAEVDPLHLPDDKYELVAAACGLSGLLVMAHRMEAALAEVPQG